MISRRPIAIDLQCSTDSGDCRLISELILHHDGDGATTGSGNGKKESENEEDEESKTILQTHWAVSNRDTFGGMTEGKESHK